MTQKGVKTGSILSSKHSLRHLSVRKSPQHTAEGEGTSTPAGRESDKARGRGRVEAGVQGWASRGDGGAVGPQGRQGQVRRRHDGENTGSYLGCRGPGGRDSGQGETGHRQPPLWAGEVCVDAVGSGLGLA